MPHIRCRGMQRDVVVAISETLVERLAELTKAPAAHFTIEYIPAEFIATRFGGQAYPFIELFWFDRGQEMQDAAAQLITSVVKAHLDQDHEIAVVVHPLVRSNYYDNGQHY
jgi:phenylpyruvate tautomerase PptA (4-oxalocrotonate tautomerase family)